MEFCLMKYIDKNYSPKDNEPNISNKDHTLYLFKELVHNTEKATKLGKEKCVTSIPHFPHLLALRYSKCI